MNSGVKALLGLNVRVRKPVTNCNNPCLAAAILYAILHILYKWNSSSVT